VTKSLKTRGVSACKVDVNVTCGKSRIYKFAVFIVNVTIENTFPSYPEFDRWPYCEARQAAGCLSLA
jgi:hypothetical protein